MKRTPTHHKIVLLWCKYTRPLFETKTKCPELWTYHESAWLELRMLKATWSNLNTGEHRRAKKRKPFGFSKYTSQRPYTFYAIFQRFPQLHLQLWSPPGVSLESPALEASTAILPQVFISLGQAAGMVLTSKYLTCSCSTAAPLLLHSPVQTLTCRICLLSHWIMNFSRDYLVWNHLGWEDVRPQLIHSYQ